MSSLSETRRLWRKPSTVKEILSPENQKVQEARRKIELRKLAKDLADGDQDAFDSIWNEVA